MSLDDKELEVNVSASRTPILKFSFPNNTEKSDIFLLTVNSGRTNRKKCVFVAISNLTCPWNDEQRTLKNNKFLARILSLGYFPLRSEDYNKGFIVIFKAMNNSGECLSRTFEETEQIKENQPKTLKITVTKIPGSSWLPITITLVLFLVLGIFMTTVLRFCWQRKKEYHERRTNEQLKSQDQDKNEDVETALTSECKEKRENKKGKGSFSYSQSPFDCFVLHQIENKFIN